MGVEIELTNEGWFIDGRKVTEEEFKAFALANGWGISDRRIPLTTLASEKTARDDYKLLDWYSKSTISSAFREEMTKALAEIDELRATRSEDTKRIQSLIHQLAKR